MRKTLSLIAAMCCLSLSAYAGDSTTGSMNNSMNSMNTVAATDSYPVWQVLIDRETGYSYIKLDKQYDNKTQWKFIKQLTPAQVTAALEAYPDQELYNRKLYGHNE